LTTKRHACYLLAFNMFATNIALANAQSTSIYTKLEGKQCRYVERDIETGNSVRKCPGVGGFHLLVAEDDARMSVIVVDKAKVEYQLNYWEVVTPAFSQLGKTAEWRVQKKGNRLQPTALIIRVNSFHQEELTKPVVKSYLAVAKITGKDICITDIIHNDKKANLEAREAANKSYNKACIKP
jgi:hypothetical protein